MVVFPRAPAEEQHQSSHGGSDGSGAHPTAERSRSRARPSRAPAEEQQQSDHTLSSAQTNLIGR